MGIQVEKIIDFGSNVMKISFFEVKI